MTNSFIPLRSIVFWLHLLAGILAGSVIAVMSFTGVVLAFEHEIVAWAERDVRRVTAPSDPANARPLPLDKLIARARAAAPAEARLADVTLARDPSTAVALSFGPAGVYRVNPYTGEVRPPASTRTHDFMHAVEDWHRRLAFSGDHRKTGRAITGACNAVFLVLALTGLYLWWPRQWTWRALRPSVRFVGARGKARDWNWHNVVGLWSLPVLIVLTTTGMVISYRWASDLAYRVAGETPPAQPGPVGPALGDLKLARPSSDSPRLTYESALDRLQNEFPAWQTITLREGLPRRRGSPPAPAAVSADDPALFLYSATLLLDDGSPSFATTQVVLHPYTGEVLSRIGYSHFTPGRKLRTWLRYLHTGQALGRPGQLIAALACVGALVLVYTGYALACRRFFKT